MWANKCINLNSNNNKDFVAKICLTFKKIKSQCKIYFALTDTKYQNRFSFQLCMFLIRNFILYIHISGCTDTLSIEKQKSEWKSQWKIFAYSSPIRHLEWRWRTNLFVEHVRVWSYGVQFDHVNIYPDLIRLSSRLTEIFAIKKSRVWYDATCREASDKKNMTWSHHLPRYHLFAICILKHCIVNLVN